MFNKLFNELVVEAEARVADAEAKAEAAVEALAPAAEALAVAEFKLAQFKLDAVEAVYAEANASVDAFSAAFVDASVKAEAARAEVARVKANERKADAVLARAERELAKLLERASEFSVREVKALAAAARFISVKASGSDVARVNAAFVALADAAFMAGFTVDEAIDAAAPSVAAEANELVQDAVKANMVAANNKAEAEAAVIRVERELNELSSYVYHVEQKFNEADDEVIAEAEFYGAELSGLHGKLMKLTLLHDEAIMLHAQALDNYKLSVDVLTAVKALRDNVNAYAAEAAEHAAIDAEVARVNVMVDEMIEALV